MPAFFVDSSALVKRYRNEPGSQYVSKLLESASQLIISRLTKVEVTAALVRRAREAKERGAELNTALAAFDSEIQNSFDVIELDEPIMDQAEAMTRKHALRGADAIQFSCFLLARHDNPDSELILLSSDDELNVVAVAEGLQVENPNLYP